jgi:hypothetical protein
MMGHYYDFITWFLIFIIAVNGRRWWASDRGRRTIAVIAGSFCSMFGVAIVAIASAVAWQEHSSGTLTGGPHGRGLRGAIDSTRTLLTIKKPRMYIRGSAENLSLDRGQLFIRVQR